MPRVSEKDKVSVWQTRVNAADKAHKDWSEKYRTKVLEEYWEGQQWAKEDLDKGAYVINLVFPSIEIKIPSLLYYKPTVRITPRPARADDQMSEITRRAKLQEDTVMTMLSDPGLRFLEQHELGIRDAMFRFAVIEIGYTAETVDNPRAGKPLLIDGVEARDAVGNAQPDTRTKIAQNEKLYIKWIPSKTFRVSYPSKNLLEENDWCGYYEWHYPDDLVRNDKLSNTVGLKATHRIQGSNQPNPAESEDEAKRRDMVKVWKIWDLRGKKRYIFVDGMEKFLYEDDFTILPFSELMFLPRLGEWYPLPVAYNWIPIQNELNETREMQRVHRKRFYRRYTYQTGTIEPDSITKLETGGDGVMVEASVPEPIHPVQDAPLDPAIVRNIPLSKEDFREVSGVTGDERGVAESETATQASILDVRSKIRESYARVKVALWLAKTCRIMLQLIIANMESKMWILANVDPQGPQAGAEAAKVFQTWREIKASELGSQIFDVMVDVESLSPMSQDQKRVNWEKGLALVMQFPQIGMSEILLKKTLAYYDITDDKELSAIQQALAAVQMMQMAQQQQKSQPAGGNQPASAPNAMYGGTALH